MPMPTIVSPSLLSADFLHLDREVEFINTSAADWLHFDVIDGVFAPNITFGFPVLSAVAPVLRKPLDVHLMTVRPEQYVRQLAAAGVRLMTVHYEACTHLHRALQEIRAAGMLAGVALCPSTPVGVVEDLLADIDVVLLMGVNPGFSGQQFIPATVARTQRLSRMIAQAGAATIIEIDGGVDARTAPLLKAAGATALVSGSYVFRAKDRDAAIAALKEG